ncbi:MAG: hypothetical protein WA324_25055 [Bryobacteraceae bacterium]
MKQLAIVVILCAQSLCAQVSGPSQEELLSLTDQLRSAMAAGDWKAAASLSASLSDAVRQARNSSLQATNSKQIGSVLSWLPKDTETIAVAQQPFTVPASNAQKQADALTAARGYILNLLSPFVDEHAMTPLDGRTLRYSVIAARKYRNHQASGNDALPLGMIAFEGCGVYALADPIQDSAFSQPPNLMILGRSVWSVEHDLGGQPTGSTPIYETSFLTRIEPDTLLACNDKSFFSSVLSQLPSASQTSRFEALPEWKQIDRLAPVWGLRHFNPATAATDPTYPVNKDSDTEDLGATGIAFQAGSPEGKIQVRWLTKSKENPLEEAVESVDFKDAMTVRRVSEGVWEMSANELGDAGNYAILVIMSMLGFAVLV